MGAGRRPPATAAPPRAATYSLGEVARLTGLSPDVLRAWERRHAAVDPDRSPGGTRRYREAHVRRLRHLRDAVDAGHPIGDIAGLDDDALKRLARHNAVAHSPQLEAILGALVRLDETAAFLALFSQLEALGPHRFARDYAVPLLQTIGERWAADELPIASEHLATSLLRSILGSALRSTRATRRGPRVVFATPVGEPHELGVLIAALTAQGAGADALFLGRGVEPQALARGAALMRARALAVGISTLSNAQVQPLLLELRSALTADTEVWLGGPRASELSAPEGVECVATLDDLERKVELLSVRVERA